MLHKMMTGQSSLSAGVLDPPNDFAEWAFRARQTEDKDWENFGTFLKAVAMTKSGKYDSRLKSVEQKAALRISSDSLGGFLVPTTQLASIWSKAVENSILLGRAMTVRMESDTLERPGIDETSRSASLYGGIIAYWTAELGTKQESNPKFFKAKLEAHKLVVLVKVSSELLDEVNTLQATLYDIVGKAMSFVLDEAFLFGAGVGMPLGILNSPALITADKKLGQANDTIIFENCLQMYKRIPDSLKASAIWIANGDTFEQIYGMNAVVGTSGTSVMLANGGYGSLPTSIFASPLYFTEKLATLGDLGDIMCVVPSEYMIGMRKDLTVKVSEALGLLTNEVYFVFELRADGQPLWNNVLTPRRSAVTQSPFVTLEAR